MRPDPQRRLPALQRLAQMKAALTAAEQKAREERAVSRGLRSELQTTQQALEGFMESLGALTIQHMELEQEFEWSQREVAVLKAALERVTYAQDTQPSNTARTPGSGGGGVDGHTPTA